MGDRARLLAWVSLGVMLGCGGPQEPAQSTVEDGLTVTVNEPGRLEASFAKDGNLIRVVSLKVGADGAATTIWVNGKRLDCKGDLAKDYFESEGYGQSLTDGEKVALGALAAPLAAAIHVTPADELPYHVRTVFRRTQYLSFAPKDYVLGHLVNGHAPGYSLGDDGVKRLTKGRMYSGYYDKGASGTVYKYNATTWKDWGTNVCGSGDYGCMGRCGGGCGGFGTIYPYRDCLDHDVCSHNLCAVAGRFSTNCGDEYANAENDFANGT